MNKPLEPIDLATPYMLGDFDKIESDVRQLEAEYKKLLEDREILFQRSLKDIGLQEKLDLAIEDLNKIRNYSMKETVCYGSSIMIMVNKTLSQLKDKDGGK